MLITCNANMVLILNDRKKALYTFLQIVMTMYHMYVCHITLQLPRCKQVLKADRFYMLWTEISAPYDL